MFYKSSVRKIEDFIESVIWKDFELELHLWLNDVRNSLEDPKGELDLYEVKKLQGCAEAIRNVLDLPETIIKNIIIELEEEKKDE